jgi:hypothetical protein
MSKRDKTLRLAEADRSQVRMVVMDPDRLVPEDDSVRAVWSFVKSLDLSAFLVQVKSVKGKAGRPPIDPRILMALWIQGTLDGIGSAREIARLCEIPEFIDERSFRLGDTMTFVTKFGDFDCLGTPSGTDGYSELVEHATTMEVEDGVSVLVASIDDIILMKRTAGRVKDLNVVEGLKLLKELRLAADKQES